MYVYITMHIGYSDVSPGARTRPLETPKNTDGLNLRIHICVHLYKVRMNKPMYEVHVNKPVLCLRNETQTECFFPFNMFFSSEKEKQKMVQTV